jgi:hypothetical protein
MLIIVRKLRMAHLSCRNETFKNINNSQAVLDFLADDREYIRFSYPSLDARKYSESHMRDLATMTNSCTSYEIFDNLMLQTFDLVAQRQYISPIVKLHHEACEFLSEVKTFNGDVVKSTIIAYTSLGTMIIENAKEDTFRDPELLAFYLSVRKMFCLLKAQELSNDDIKNLESAYKILFDGCFRCIYNEEEANSLLEFSSVVWRDSFDSLIQVFYYY